MKPTIYKPSIYKGAGIYKIGAGGGGENLLYIKKMDWFGIIDIPEETKSYEYTIEEEPAYYEYYIGTGAAFPCRNSGYKGIVFAADSLDEVNVIDANYIREWDASSWDFQRFYLYELQNITYPLKVKGVFEIGNFKLYINGVLRFEINSNKINPSTWNRYRSFYSGPSRTDFIENDRYFLEDVIFTKE